MTSSEKYLVRNPHSYCFRMRVPGDLQVKIGRKELRYSLRTGYIGEAKNKAMLVAGLLKTIFKQLRTRGSRMKELSDEKVKELANKYIREAIEAWDYPPFDDEYGGYPIGNASDLNGYLDQLGFIREDLILNMNKGDYSMLESNVLELLRESGANEIDKQSPSYKKLCTELHKAEIKLIPFEKQHRMGNYEYKKELKEAFSEIFTSKPELQGQLKEEDEKTIEDNPVLLSEVMQTFWDENMREENWGERTQTDYNTCRTLLFRILEDTAIASVDYKEIRDLKETIQKLPPYLNRAKYKGKSISDIIEIGAGEKRDKKTVKKYLGFYQSFFKWAYKDRYIEKDLAPILAFKDNAKKRVDEEKKVFNKDDLIKIFSSDRYMADKHLHPYMFYLPILGLFTGCRIEEICQLYVEDVREENGVWILDINTNKDKRLKNISSKRIIPLHPFLTDDVKFPLHVMQLREEGSERVFPELKKQSNRYSHYATRTVGKFLRIECEIMDKDKTFHSFRHTFINYLKQNDFERSMAKQLAGHSDSDTTFGRYGKRYDVVKLGVLISVNSNVFSWIREMNNTEIEKSKSEMFI